MTPKGRYTVGSGNDLVTLTFLVPRSWFDRLREIADDQCQTVAGIARMYLRSCLYDRDGKP